MASKAPTLAEIEEAADDEPASETMYRVMAAAVGEGKDEPAAETPAEVPAEEKEAAGQPRDEYGRFAPKDAQGGEKEPQEEEPAPSGDAEESEAEQPPADVREPIEPPYEWKAAEQERFRKLSREDQEFVLAQYNTGRQAAEAGKRYSAIDQLLEPRRQAIALQGNDEATYLKQILAASDFAARDPVNFVRWFAQQRGLTPQQLFAQAQQQQQQQHPQVDPEIARLYQAVNGLQQNWQQQQQVQQQAEAAVIQNEITAFETAKDDKGRPLHPYFNEVRQLMGDFVRAGRVSERDLKSAYDMACRADPEVSAKIAASERDRLQREQAAAQRKKAEAARKAGSSVTGTPGDRARSAPSGDVREELAARMREAGYL